jgi:hypothetical protein
MKGVFAPRAEILTLIREMARDNVAWGAPRIHGEAAQVGQRGSLLGALSYTLARA